MASNRSQAFYPSLCVFAGATLWGVVWYPMRLLEAQGLWGIWLTLILYATALCVSLPYTRRSLSHWQESPLWLTVLVLSAGWTNVAFVEAVLEGNVVRVLLLFYLSPVWASAMGWLFLGERMSRLGIVSLVIATAGAMLMLWDPRIDAPWPQTRADWLSLSAGFAFALSNVATRRMQSVSIATKVFGVGFGVVLIVLVTLAVSPVAIPDVSPLVVAGAIALGIVILGMTLLIQYGVTHLPVYRSAVITFTELIAGAISQQLLTDEVVTAYEWAGGALIVAGAYLAVSSTTTRRRRTT